MRILKIIGGSIAAMLIIIISQFVSQIIAGIVPYVWMSEIVQTLLYVGIALALGFVFTHCILKMKMRLSKSRLCVRPLRDNIRQSFVRRVHAEAKGK